MRLKGISNSYYFNTEYWVLMFCMLLSKARKRKNSERQNIKQIVEPLGIIKQKKMIDLSTFIMKTQTYII